MGGQPLAHGPDPAHDGLASGPPPCLAITLQSGPRDLHLVPLRGTTTGKEIFDAICFIVWSNTPWIYPVLSA